MAQIRDFSSTRFNLELPYLLEVQKNSYESFLQMDIPPSERKNIGLERVFNDAFPITDMKGLYRLKYQGFSFGVPKYTIRECRERGLTYSFQLKARMCLEVWEEEGETRKLKESIENEVIICELPKMTENGTFIINGAERVVVSQLHRSPGVSFDEEISTAGATVFKCRIIPNRGSWIELNTEKDFLQLQVDRKGKMPATILLRCVGQTPTAKLMAMFYKSEFVKVDIKSVDAFMDRILFDDVIDIKTGEIIAKAGDTVDARIANLVVEAGIEKLQVVLGNIDQHGLLHASLLKERDICKQLFERQPAEDKNLHPITREMLDTIEGSRTVFYMLMHPDQHAAPTKDVADRYFENLFFDPKSYDLGEVGRYRLNQKVHRFIGKALTTNRLPSDEEMRAQNGLRKYIESLPHGADEIPHWNTPTLTPSDIIAIVEFMDLLYIDGAEGLLPVISEARSDGRKITVEIDDIDHLGNRRVRSIGELLGAQLSLGLQRISRAIRERLSVRDQESFTPADLVNTRTVSTVVQAFFGSSQLSQFMDQTNPLAELTHKRRMSALGPGGLTRERAGFEVRDVHHTHYGRLCPIETPEGPNIGLINSMATYSVINHFGFLETPYRVVGEVEFKDESGKVALVPEERWHLGVYRAFLKDPVLLSRERLDDKQKAKVRSALDSRQAALFDSFVDKVFQFQVEGKLINVRNGLRIADFHGKPDFKQSSATLNVRVTDYVVFLTADEEDHWRVAPASTLLDENGWFVNNYVIVRKEGEFPAIVSERQVEISAQVERPDLMDVSPKQIVSVAAGLIPFLEHDDANRALMGSNMQRQAVPLLRSEAPVVNTGMERRAAMDSGTMVRAKYPGVITFVDAMRIDVKRDTGVGDDLDFLGLPDTDSYELRKYERSNQDTCINQKPIVAVGQRVGAGDVLADGASTQEGELALGKNILVGFLPWNGYNFEDAIIISEELSIKDTFTSIHIEEYEVEVRDTKRGPEELTRELPNVAEESLVNLDENGIIRVGAEVEQGDILVGKVTPKGETELTPEERLLRAIFGEKAGDVRDSSLKAPPGMKGVVVETRVFSRKDRDKKAKADDRDRIEAVKADSMRRRDEMSRARDEKLGEILVGQTTGEVRDSETNGVLVASGKKWTKQIVSSVDFLNVSMASRIAKEDDANSLAMKVLHVANQRIREIDQHLEKELDKINRGDELKPGVLQMVKVYIAKKRRLQIGDKMAGRHGNKGVISKVVPVEDMPFTDDGRPLQIVLNPLGVPSRMNVGQVLEVHLGWAAKALGYRAITPVFDGATFEEIQDEMEKANLGVTASELGVKGAGSERRTGKVWLNDGRTGDRFQNPVTVGYMYMLKLGHLVDDKIHARSIGPYSLVTQQPLGGKSQFGGQRFGEMEVWALEAYGAAYTLQELLTVKSDDVIGRSKVYESIVKGENTPPPGVPESFQVLIREIRALGLNITPDSEEIDLGAAEATASAAIFKGD